jgi:hypothetical protein
MGWNRSCDILGMQPHEAILSFRSPESNYGCVGAGSSNTVMLSDAVTLLAFAGIFAG